MKTIGTGIVLKTESGTYLLQERDYNTPNNPGRIAVFGGGIEGEESVLDCAKRELFEELVLDIDTESLEDIGLFPSEREDEIQFQLFLLRDIDRSILNLREGRSIVEFSKEEALESERVTDFTKQVLRSL